MEISLYKILQLGENAKDLIPQTVVDLFRAWEDSNYQDQIVGGALADSLIDIGDTHIETGVRSCMASTGFTIKKGYSTALSVELPHGLYYSTSTENANSRLLLFGKFGDFVLQFLKTHGHQLPYPPKPKEAGK